MTDDDSIRLWSEVDDCSICPFHETDYCHGSPDSRQPCRDAEFPHDATCDDAYEQESGRHLAIARPEFYVVENVPGMKAFPIVMEAMTKMPDYYVQVFCPIKSETWLPQKRSRLIIIGTKRHFTVRPPENTKPITLAEILEDEPQITIPSAVASRMSGKYRDLPIISDPGKGDIAPTCVAHYAKDKSTRLVVDKRFPLGVRPYSKREYARLQGVPDSFIFPVSDTAAYRQIGNGVSVTVGNWIGTEMMRYMHLNTSH